MFSSLVLGAALAAPAAPMPQNSSPAPSGPAPWVVYLKADDSGRVTLSVSKVQKVNVGRAVATVENGKRVTKRVQEQEDRLVTTHVVVNDSRPTFATAAGTTLAADVVLKRAKDGLVVLVSADGKPVAKGWLRAVDPDAVVVTAEGLASQIAPRSLTPAPTGAPRLVLLGTGPDGKVQVAYNPTPGAGGDGPELAARQALLQQQVLLANANGVQVVVNNFGGIAPNPHTLLTAAPFKPLGEIKFDAYDLRGEKVAREEAVKRLTAGGLVLVSGDAQLPDAAYRKAFRGDLLVLVSPELVNVPVGGAKPVIREPGQRVPVQAVPLPAGPIQVVPLPAPAQAVPLPAPILRVKPAIIQARPLPAPVDPVEEKPAK